MNWTELNWINSRTETTVFVMVSSLFGIAWWISVLWSYNHYVHSWLLWGRSDPIDAVETHTDITLSCRHVGESQRKQLQDAACLTPPEPATWYSFQQDSTCAHTLPASCWNQNKRPFTENSSWVKNVQRIKVFHIFTSKMLAVYRLHTVPLINITERGGCWALQIHAKSLVIKSWMIFFFCK